MNKSEQLKKEQLLEAMVNTLGIVSTACLNMGVSRTTYYTSVSLADLGTGLL
jgi:transcriptional regulator of acetoin/glycerol metabolism